MEEVKEDMKKYPSLPANYVSIVQLQERWIQQQQQKQEDEKKEQEQQQEEQEEQVASENHKARKNGRRRIHRGVNGQRRIDVRFPQRQWDGNDKKIWAVKNELKCEKLELQASGGDGSNGRWNAMRKTGNKCNQRRRRPGERLNGKDPVQTLAEDGEKSAVLIGKSGVKEANPENVERNGYEKERVREIESVCMVELLPEIKGNEVNPMGFSRISCGKQLVNDQFSSRNASRRFKGKSRRELVVNGQFSGSANDERVKLKSRGKKAVNGQFWSNSDDRGVEGSVNENMIDVLPENVSKEEVLAVLKGKNGQRYNNEFKRSGDDEGLVEEGNGYMAEVLHDNEEEGEGSGDEKSRFQGHEGNRRMTRNYNDNKAQLKLDQRLVKEGVFEGQNERNGPKTRTGRRVHEYGNKDRVSGNQRPNIIRDFRDLSLYGSRKGYSNRGQIGSYGRRFASARKGRQVDGGLIWVKKEERSGSNAAEVS